MRSLVDTECSRGEQRPWWHDAVFYRVDLRSFADSTSDGIGDLNGMLERFGYLELLGVDALWLTTLLGSTVTDRVRGRSVDPVLGDLAEFEQLVAEAHASGIRVAIDAAVDAAEVQRRGGHEELVRNLRFWLDLGVDGVRIGTPDNMTGAVDDRVAEVFRLVRRIVDEYPNRAIGALVDSTSGSLLSRPESADLGVDMRFGDVVFDADPIRGNILDVLASVEGQQRPAVWALANRHEVRPVTRFGGGPHGLARARAMALITLALPGVTGVDNGEELGLPDADLSGLVRSFRTRGAMPWEGSRPPFGFSGAPGSWWPLPADWSSCTVEAQLEDPDSTLSLYRRALDIRKNHLAFGGDQVEWYGAPTGCFAFRRVGGRLICALNTSPDPVPLPPGDLLLASRELSGDQLPPDTAAWLA